MDSDRALADARSSSQAEASSGWRLASALRASPLATRRARGQHHGLADYRFAEKGVVSAGVAGRALRWRELAPKGLGGGPPACSPRRCGAGLVAACHARAGIDLPRLPLAYRA
jgi:hypothetical protein